MIHNINRLYHFARSRQRKGVPIPTKLKDLAHTQHIKIQIGNLRRDFENINPSHTFTELLKSRKVKFGRHFHINYTQIQKIVKKAYNSKIQVSKVQAYSGDDLNYLVSDKSYLYDQQAQIQFEKKFNHELFVKKQTNRLIAKQKNNYKNFLKESANQEYLQYERNKNILKNKRIENMMNYQRNNEQLQLLIQSGMIDQPQNLKNIIASMHKRAGQKQLLTNKNIINDKNLVKQEEKIQLQGMTLLQSYNKLQQFLTQYTAMNKKDQERTEDSVNLLKQIKQYESSLFMSRYNAINFRFKGRTQFTHFQESQLLSYIKNQFIQPRQLLLLYEQNKNKFNKFEYPIITPAVRSRLYAKTSTYMFPETDVNNRVVMLKDDLFVKLERQTFMEIKKINDEMFCDIVWAYSKNHENQQGILAPIRYKKIHEIIMTQIEERIFCLQEDNLGLLCKSIIKMNLLKIIPFERWFSIIDALKQKLKLIENKYYFQSIMNLLSLIPVSQESIQILAQHIDIYRTYKWEYEVTLKSFLKVSAILIRFKHKLGIQVGIKKTMLSLRNTLNKKNSQILLIVSQVSINNLSNLLTIIQQLLNFSGEGQQMPINLVNLSKKVIVDSIRMQKTLLYKHTLPKLAMSLALVDYQYSLARYSFQWNQSLMKQITFLQFLPIRVHPFNSINYFVYHELAKLMELQTKSLSVSCLSTVCFGLSIAQYKNQSLYDQILDKIIQKISKQTYYKNLKALSIVLICYSLQKRTNQIIQQIVQQICQHRSKLMAQLNPTLVVHMLSAVSNVFLWINSSCKMNVVNMFIQLGYSLERYLKYLQCSEIVTLLYCYSLIYSRCNRMEDIDLDGRHLQLLEILDKINKSIKIEQLTMEQKYIKFLCQKVLNNISFQKIVVGQQQQFMKLEKMFYEKYIDQIVTNQAHIGCKYPYNYIYEKIIHRLSKQYGESALKILPWRIEIASQNKVYLIGTYQHFMVRTQKSTSILNLYGFWKLYAQLYQKLQMILVCTFTQN